MPDVSNARALDLFGHSKARDKIECTMTMRPKSVQFRLMTAAQVREQSVLEVKRRDDLTSPLLGTTHGPCGSCGLHPFQCNGHYGHIEIPTRCPHPMHVALLQRIARRLCSACGKRITAFHKQCVCGGSPVHSSDWAAPAWGQIDDSEWTDMCAGQRVSSLFIEALPVPPIRLRQPNNEHDAPLTSMLAGVLLYCARYRRSPTPRASSAIYASIHRYMRSEEDTGSTGLLNRIRGKQGRFRQNIMGWRVNYAGRAVITPDPLLAPWEVGVPRRIATELGISDGDTCIMNRQPSLHRGSMMAHIARIRHNTHTLSISPTVTVPYNADFDGDEMNLHKVDKACWLDARMLMGVEQNMVGAAYNNVQIHAVQDFALATYLEHGIDAKQQKRDLHAIIGQQGQATACRYLHRQQAAAHNWMSAHGFSVGLDDFAHSIPPVVPGRMAISRTADVIVNALPPSNRLKIMSADAKTKGSTVNLVQLFSCVGYQTVRGEASRPPHFAPQSSSFVSSSFVQGLNPSEFWHHAAAAREGMIETAIKTAKCGYIMRKLVKLLENVRVEYDDTVRSNGRVVQFKYGGDGYDATKMVRQGSGYIQNVPEGQSCHAEPGEPVGIICAQCIGHPLTQMTLDTFHSTGIAQDHGIAAVERLLSTTAQPPHRVFGLPRPYIHVNITLRDVLECAPVDFYHTFTNRQRFEMSLHGCKPRTGAPLTALTIDSTKLLSMGMQPWQLASSLKQTFCDGTFLIDVKDNRVRILCIGVHVASSACIGSSWAVPGASIHRGGVASAHAFSVDTSTVYTSDVQAMASTLGIEAARTVLERELLSRLGGIDARHVSLLTDYMSHTGILRGIDRVALKEYSPSDVISNASFESAIGVVADAARKCRTDNLVSVSSRLTMGVMPALGTGAFDVISHEPQAQSVHTNVTGVAEFLHGPRRNKRSFAQLMQGI